MDMQLYLHHYREFLNEFDPDADINARVAKTLTESMELREAWLFSGDDDSVKEEAIDLMNCAISLVSYLGVKNPLHAGYMKLQATAEKYRGQHGAE